MSAVRDLMNELEKYKDLAAVGEEAVNEVKHLRDVLSDFNKCKSELVCDKQAFIIFRISSSSYHHGIFHEEATADQTLKKK